MFTYNKFNYDNNNKYTTSFPPINIPNILSSYYKELIVFVPIASSFYYFLKNRKSNSKILSWPFSKHIYKTMYEYLLGPLFILSLPYKVLKWPFQYVEKLCDDHFNIEDNVEI